MECNWHNCNCNFRSFFALLPHYWLQKLKFGKNWKKPWMHDPLTHAYHKSRSYDVWFLRFPKIWSAIDRTFLSSWAIFCPFTPLIARKMKKSKMKKTPGDIILNKCAKNHDHMLYCFRDITHERCNCYFHFGLYFWAIIL